MSLDYDLTKIKDNETVCWLPEGEDGERQINPITKMVTFACLIIGIGEITEKNAEEFYQRVAAEEKINGPWLYEEKDGKMIGRPITPADVYTHIGLRTNVFPKRAITAWRGQVLRRTMEDAAKSWQAYMKERRAG